MNYLEQTKQILSNVIYATIATVDESGKPWNSPVFVAIDSELNIYWSSSPESQHSKNIAANGRAFLVIYNSSAAEGDGMGVYIKASFSQVTEEIELQRALNYLSQRRGKPLADIDHYRDAGPQRIYKAVPRKIWTNDADRDADGNFIRDYRIEIPLNDLK